MYNKQQTMSYTPDAADVSARLSKLGSDLMCFPAMQSKCFKKSACRKHGSSGALWPYAKTSSVGSSLGFFLFCAAAGLMD